MEKKEERSKVTACSLNCINLPSLGFSHEKTAAGTSDTKAPQTPACIDLAFLSSSLGLYTPLWLIVFGQGETEVVMKD